MSTKILFFIFSMVLHGSLFGQHSEVINSDRPGQINSPNTVGFRVLQVQTGYDNFFDTPLSLDPDVRQHTMAGNLGIRFGPTESFEIMSLLNVQQDWISSPGFPTHIANGLSSAQLLVRQNIIPEANGLLPAIGLIVGLSLPVNSAAYEIEHIAPEVQLSTSHGLGDSDWSIGTFWVAAWDGNSSQPTWKYAVNCSFPLLWEGGLNGFVENYGNLSGGVFSTYFDAGLAFLVNDDFQLDLAGGMGINRERLESFVSLGVSWRTVLK